MESTNLFLLSFKEEEEAVYKDVLGFKQIVPFVECAEFKRTPLLSGSCCIEQLHYQPEKNLATANGPSTKTPNYSLSLAEGQAGVQTLCHIL